MFLEKIYYKIFKKFSSTKLNTNNRPKVAFISVYNTPCGISTYNQELINELSYYADIKVFAEYQDGLKAKSILGDPNFVTRCWDRNEHPKRNLIKEIEDFSPDLIHFSHEYGFFPKAYQFTGLVSTLKNKGFKVLATMHSIYNHKDKTVQEAAVDYIISHTHSGKATLAKKGIDPNKISVIPHGTSILNGTSDNPELLPELFNTWHTDHTIFQPGFMFFYKGHLRMLDVVARLKKKYPDIHYIIQGSENPRNQEEHNDLYRQLVNKIKYLNIEENVTINRGFIEKEALMSYIRTAKVCVLPYSSHPDHDVRATSGAARMVMSTETPLVVTTAHLFDDLDGLVPRVGNDEELYNEIDSLFSDWKQKQKQLDLRKQFLRNTSWEKVAHSLASIYRIVIGEE